MVKPYKEISNEGFIIRIFDNNTLEPEFVWHRDERNRLIIPMEGSDWKFQIDNELPKKIIQHREFIIKKDIYHRVIKGKDTLIIYIYEYDGILNPEKIENIKKNAIQLRNQII